MPSNKDLAAEAEAIAAELKLEVTTEGLSNAQLAELVSDLKAKKVDAEKQTAAKTGAAIAEAGKKADEVRAASRVKPVRKKPPFYIAPRCAITTKRGILDGDTEDEIRAEDLPGGKEALDGFVESGHVLKGG